MIISYENMLQLMCFKILFKQQNLQPFTDFLSEKLTKNKIFFSIFRQNAYDESHSVKKCNKMRYYAQKLS